jgi:LacI family transcriptional regulator
MASPTIKDIARELGLSTATVSRALQDSHEIGAETKRKVMELAKQLNYQPNPYASSLRNRKSKTIAVVLPEVADSFFSLAINGIESVAKEKGYHVLIYLTHESLEREKAILSEFKSGRVDGLLISVSEETTSGQHIREVIEEDIPVVFFDRECADVDTAKVVTNDFESGYLAASHLAEQGCKKIAYLCVAPSLSISRNRTNGFRQALQDHSLPCSEESILLCQNSAEQNRKLIKELLQRKAPPDGIIASVEKLTTPVYLACKELGLQIPQQVKLLSFTNLQTSQILNPPLTTITQPAFEMGAGAATVLFKSLDKKRPLSPGETIVIKSELTQRDSSR